MDTLQRNATPAIPPWPYAWSTKRQLGFGIVAIIPLALLGATLFTLLLSAFEVGLPLTHNVLPILAYTHVSSQFITLLIFGHLMVGNPALSNGMKLVWGFFFLVAAPFAVAAYWAMHVWRAEDEIPTGTTVHVYDYDYRHETGGTERREDKSIVHHIDATS